MKQKTTNRYDYIVYGASLTGCILSIIKSNQHKSVLLINHYGFPGGYISESLSCYQNIIVSDLPQFTRNALDNLIQTKNGFKNIDYEHFYINSESLKLVLQQELEKTAVDILFHAKGTRIDSDSEGKKKLFLLAKEGEISFSADKIIDASDDRYLTSLFNDSISINKNGRINFIVASNTKIEMPAKFSTAKVVSIDFNRYWVSIDLGNCNISNSYEDEQKLIDDFSWFLQERGARIQILPPQSEYTISNIPELANPNFIDINIALNNNFTNDNLFTKAAAVEKIENIF